MIPSISCVKSKDNSSSMVSQMVSIEHNIRSQVEGGGSLVEDICASRGDSSVDSSQDQRSMLETFNSFCRGAEDRILDSLHINKDVIDELKDPETLMVMGSSEPKEKKRLFISAYMNFKTHEVADLRKEPNDLDCFSRGQ